MAQESESQFRLRDVVRLVMQIEQVVDQDTLRVADALRLRHQAYDVMKHFERVPITRDTERLHRWITQAFALLQARLGA